MGFQELFWPTRSSSSKGSSKAPSKSSISLTQRHSGLNPSSTSWKSFSKAKSGVPSTTSTNATRDRPLPRRAARRRGSSVDPSRMKGKFQSVPVEVLRELEDAFKFFDANGDGKISASELGSVLRSLGDAPSEEELLMMVSEVDADGDGYVDLEEFLKLNASFQSMVGGLASTEELKEVFSVFDADSNGYISAEELHRVLVNLGENGASLDDCHRMIRGVDSDGDGFVNFKEFEKMMTST